MYVFARKLTEKLREAYAPLAEGCCKAMLTTISSSIAELNSGTGTYFKVSFTLLERNNTFLMQMPTFARSRF
jgi:hypothetical protein